MRNERQVKNLKSARFNVKLCVAEWIKNNDNNNFSRPRNRKRALGFLLGRFSGRVLKTGEHLVPEAALEALADQNISFTVKGKATYEQQITAVRDIAPASI